MLLIGIIGILVIIYFISVYNSLVKYKNWVEESWAQIDVQLKRRYDLIPNLVNTVKGYAKHEQETFEQIVNARNQLLALSQREENREEIMKQNDALTNSLKSIFSLHEAYPELKANENFLKLQEELTTTENKISYARQLYNSTVAKYNMKTEVFPSCIIANITGFKRKELFNVTSEVERESFKVEF